MPLLERMRFLTISSSILDEFFEVRVGWLKEQIAFGLTRVGEDGLGAAQTLERIRAIALEIVAEQYRLLNDVLLPALEPEGIFVHRREKWRGEVAQVGARLFRPRSASRADPARSRSRAPVPAHSQQELELHRHAGGQGRIRRKSSAAVVQAPRALPRLIAVPREIADARIRIRASFLGHPRARRGRSFRE